MLSKNPKSLIIVLIQFFTLFYLFITGNIIPQNIISFILEIGGFSLGLWAIYTMRTTSFRITPEVAKGAILIENGPYTYIRHPMYLSLMLISIGLVLNLFTFSRLIALIILLIDLLIKINLEEKFLLQHFKEYKDYMKRTYRLIPFIY